MNNRQTSGEITIVPKLLYDHLSTGDAEYHDATTMSLVEYDIWNNTRDTIEVAVVSEIKGYSSDQPNTLTLAPGKHRICRHLPVISNNMINRLRRNTTVSVLTSYNYKRAEKWSGPINNAENLTLMRYNTVLWAVPNPDSESGRTFLLEHIIAWIDPDHELVQDMLGKAYELLPLPKRFGYQLDYDPENTRAQVEAIYNALRASNKLRYVPASKIARLGKGEISQVVRRPEDSLNSGLSNCIDGAVLYASLIEAAGLAPVIVIKQGHAFVGWKTCNSDLWKRLRPGERYEFLDTTWTQDWEFPTNFQLAWEEGARLYNEIQQNNWLNNDPFSSNGFAHLVDVSSWRRRFERDQVKSVPYLIKDIENPPDAADDGAPGSITLLPQPDNGSNTSQNEHLLAASRYIIKTEQSLMRIQSRISGSMSANDCGFAGSILRPIQRPDLPEVENIFSEERRWTYRLDALWSDIYRLTISIDALQSAQANNSRRATPLQPLEVQRSLAGPDIPALYRDLLERTEKIAGDLKAAMMPEETGTKHDIMMRKQREESEINATPPPPETSGAIEVFYSNVSEDEHLAEQLRKHLVLLKQRGLITDWYAGMIGANQETDEQIRKHLNSAGIILLFISSGYLNSNRHTFVEVKRAMERSRAGEAIVMPILLSTIDGLSDAPFGKLQIFPRNRKPIHKWPDKNDALAEIAGEIRKIVTDLNHKAEAG